MPDTLKLSDMHMNQVVENAVADMKSKSSVRPGDWRIEWHDLTGPFV